ncbi:MAG: hypothetical protein OXM61_16055 [Candidatus Poribacteria bacterium]|nr:hypothetical protein [Candidatus Poribacteria bacterium]
MQRVRNYQTKRIEYRSFLFDRIDFEKGVAVPSDAFLKLWNSEKREAVARAGFTLIPVMDGDCRKGWKVLLPKTSATAPIGHHLGK